MLSSHFQTRLPLEVSRWRRLLNHLVTAAAGSTVIIVLLPLVAIFGYLLYRGLGAVNLAFLTQTPKPVGEPGGGMANAIIGSGVILGIATALGVPLGIGAGIYLAEYGRGWPRLAIRFTGRRVGPGHTAVAD